MAPVQGGVVRACVRQRERHRAHPLRERGPGAFVYSILAVVRGKREAHGVERGLIRELQPTLNTDVRTAQ